MVNYREILRLTSLGYSQRQIAASVHSSRSTISEVQELARKADLSFPLDESVTNEVLLMTFHPNVSQQLIQEWNLIIVSFTKN